MNRFTTNQKLSAVFLILISIGFLQSCIKMKIFNTTKLLSQHGIRMLQSL